jgi:thiol-disulfide isomerase/thioredoxin
MKRCTAMMGLAIVLLLSAAATGAAADRAVLAEMFGGTWCGYCPQAHAALQILRTQYTEDQFIPIYYHVGGADPFRTAESQARASWYGVGGVPEVVFDGGTPAIGTTGSVETMVEWYSGLIDDRLAVPSPITIEVTGAIGDTSGWVTATVRAVDTVGYTNQKVQFVLYENGTVYNSNEYDFTFRDMLPSEIVALSAPGDSVVITRNFSVDPTWDNTRMGLAVFLEDTGLKEIVQSALMPPPYNLAFSVDKNAEEINYGGMSHFVLTLTNRGTLTDTIDMDIRQDALPPGVLEWDWFAMYCDSHGVCYFGPHTLVLGPGASEVFDVEVTDYLGNVRGRAVTTVTAASHGEPTIQLEESFGTFVDAPTILLVDDDGGQSYQTYLETALADTGYPTMVWDANERGRPGSTLLTSFWAVCWTTANSDCSDFSTSDEERIADYLDHGGNLFLAGMNFLSSRATTTPFIADYLHIDSWSSDIGSVSVTGVSGDPISNGMSLGLASGPFSPADSDGFTSDGTPDITFTALSIDRGLRVEEDGHKAAFTAFPFEDVKVVNPAPNNQKALARRVIEWFMLPTDVPEGPGSQFSKLAMGQNYPNPFNPTTTLAFTVPPDAGPISLAIYSASGRLVRTLARGDLPAGPHAITWDGTDDAGRPLSSGVYFARLAAGSSTAELKMTLLK